MSRSDQLSNAVGATLIMDQASIVGVGSVANQGTMTVQGGGASAIDVPLTNLNDQIDAGTVELRDQFTELALSDQIVNEGAISLGSGTTMDLLNDQLSDQLSNEVTGDLVMDQASITGPRWQIFVAPSNIRCDLIQVDINTRVGQIAVSTVRS